MAQSLGKILSADFQPCYKCVLHVCIHLRLMNLDLYTLVEKIANDTLCVVIFNNYLIVWRVIQIG